nr:protein BEX4-like [Aotus nancymaae]
MLLVVSASEGAMIPGIATAFKICPGKCSYLRPEHDVHAGREWLFCSLQKLLHHGLAMGLVMLPYTVALESHCHLGGGDGQKPGGNIRWGRVRRLVPNFRWAIPNRHSEHNEARDDVERFVGQMMEIKRKTREQQIRHYMRFQTPEPDNHYDFCLIP